MKRGLLIYLVFLSALSVSAQTKVYHPFPSCYAAWGQSVWDLTLSGPKTTYYNYYLAGDTVLNSQTYHIVRRADTAHDTYYAAIREDSSKRILIRSGKTEELLYDFSLNVGDIMQPSYIFPGGAIVGAIDSVLVGASYRKMFEMDDYNFCGCSDYVIEGIGGSQDLFYVTSSLADGFGLDCFSQNGEALYSPGPCHIYKMDTTTCSPPLPPPNNDTGNQVTIVPFVFNIYPNPASEHVKIECSLYQDQIGAEIIVADAVGRIINTIYLETASNVYSQDLKGLANGVYSYTLVKDNKVIAWKKLVVVQPH